MSYTLRPAQRGNAKPLVGLYGESGAGKTWSALMLARGFVGPHGKIAMIETEAGRGEIYTGADPVGDYLVCSLGEPFSPAKYGEAISACEKAGVDALIIDSASHEWEAVGGVLDMASENEAKGWKGQIVWTKPKLEHSRHFVLRFAQTPIPLVILCLRSKYPLEEYTDDKGKKQMRRVKVPVPIQSDTFISEMLIHGWIDREHNLHVTKYPSAVSELRGVVKNGEPITVETGARLHAWAAGTNTPKAESQSGETQGRGGVPPAASTNGEKITEKQESSLLDHLEAAGVTIAAFNKRAGIDKLTDLQADRFDAAIAALKQQAERNKERMKA